MRERANPKLRFLDRYFGIPLVFLAGLLKQKCPFPEKINTVALLKTAGIGDTVLLSGIIKDLQRLPLRVTLYTGKANQEVGKLIPGDFDVVALPITRPFESIEKIREREYDVWIDCDPWPRINALLSFFSRSHYTIGFHTPQQHRHHVYDRAIPHSTSVHEIQNYRHLLDPLGIRGEALPTLQSTSVPKKEQVVLHLFSGGSRGYLKQWPEERWKELIRFLLAKGFQVVLTGGKKERQPLDKIAQAFEGQQVQNVAGSLSLKETAEVLSASRCAVSVDTGMMHLAAALGVPLIALHGPTSPKRWGALGENVLPLTPPFAYHPCIQLGFESTCHVSHCMQAITLDSVQAALEKVLERKLESF